MNEPVAWGIECDGKLLASYTCEDRESAVEMVARFAASRAVIVAAVPLYRQPQPTLTDAEREAVEAMAHWCEVDCGYCRDADEQPAADHYAARAATLRGLLERLGGGE